MGGREVRSAQLSPGSTRLIVELPASRVPRRADSSNYQPDSSNYQLQADNPADNPAVSFVVAIPVQLRGQMGVSDAIMATWRRKILADIKLHAEMGSRLAAGYWRLE